MAKLKILLWATDQSVLPCLFIHWSWFCWIFHVTWWLVDLICWKTGTNIQKVSSSWSLCDKELGLEWLDEENYIRWEAVFCLLTPVHLHLRETGHSFEDSWARALARDRWFERGVNAICVKLEKKAIFEQRWWTETSMIQTFTPFHRARWLIVMTPRCQTGSPRKWNQASDPANHARVATQIVSPRGPSLQALAPAVFRTEEAEEAKCLQEAKPSPVAHRDHALGNNENLKETFCHQQVLKLETFDITLVNFCSLVFSLL